MPSPTLELSGALLLAASWLCVGSVVAFCIRRVLRSEASAARFPSAPSTGAEAPPPLPEPSAPSPPSPPASS